MTPRRLGYRLSARTVLIALGVVAGVAIGDWYWHESAKRQQTYNAYVNARVVQVSSLVMGQVVAVPVAENQFVHRGDPCASRRPKSTRRGSISSTR
jgi:membrane fusion protein (multidrug efflux system)